ncbi:MAG: phenylalanine--tRNA ligase subunit alpha [Armatimonadetes bacterium]|nr:phenylalanine--tRNA ligase subunit alpha [Armatimonadota bacterium]
MSQVATVESAAIQEVQAASSSAELRAIEIKYLGKSGELTTLLRLIGTLPNEEKPKFGQQINEAKARVTALIEERDAALKGGEMLAQFEREKIDITLPGRPWRIGREHVLQLTANKIRRVLGGLGFRYIETPELEHVNYNFAALNYPPDHPAMDDQDTFYIDDDTVLRTQCTAMQGRIFEKVKPPLRYFTVGRTFRNEAVDRTHGHTFHQVDAVMIDEGISMADLKGVLELFAREMFGENAQVRFRPDFFPFVEPGVDYAISSPKFAGGRWLELGGAGLVHPNILRAYGIDEEKYSGFAFGLGVERIPMLAHGVDDLRHFLENDLRFLDQFTSEI